jgi:hypothetical protein
MKVEGACHCGHVRYEAEIDPATVGICHCIDCQVLTGSPYRVVVYAAAAGFRLLGAAPKIYVKIADSGKPRAQAFCPECGTPIYAAAPVDPQSYSLRIGAIKQRRELVPRRQIWCRSALPWVEDLGGFDKIDGQPA